MNFQNSKKVLMVNVTNFENKPLVRLPTLPFNFKEGACATFSEPDGKEFALLCFDRENPTICYNCTDLTNAKTGCTKHSITTKTRNAIRLGNYKGRIQIPTYESNSYNFNPPVAISDGFVFISL